MAEQGTKTPIDPGVLARLGGGISAAARAFSDTWFGPGRPLPQVAPDDTPPRAFDFMPGLNSFYAPRGYEPISFAQLRGLSENLNVLRLVIETRKDQIVKLPWEIRLRQEPGQKKADSLKKSEGDSRVKELRKFFRKPDLANPWETWLRMVLEEVLVIDAPSIVVRRMINGTPAALEVIDGATIHPLVDASGRQPLAGQIDPETKEPMPAYQQIIKGAVLENFLPGELLYLPRNRRVHKLYGFSPVEQIIFLVNVALRRDLSRLDFYTVGNLPLGIARTPKEWSQKQVADFQKAWDAMMEATENRQKLKFIPDIGSDPIFPKIDMLKDDFDDYVLRTVCYCFSVSPSNLVKQMNRATADNAHEESRQEGYQPLMTSIKSMMDLVIETVWGYDDIEFDWRAEREEDGTKQAGIDKIHVDAGIKTPNEIRDDMGLEPLSTPEANGIKPPPVIGLPGQPGAPPPTDKKLPAVPAAA